MAQNMPKETVNTTQLQLITVSPSGTQLTHGYSVISNIIRRETAHKGHCKVKLKGSKIMQLKQLNEVQN